MDIVKLMSLFSVLDKLSWQYSAIVCLLPALPQHDPKIEGIEKNYYEGDFLFGNCTSDYSFPPPILAWYINGQEADSHLLQPYQESAIEGFGFKLLQRSLEIRFRIDKMINPFAIDGLADGKVHMKCVTQIWKIPSHNRESSHIFYVSSLNELKNQKLINWKNSGLFQGLKLKRFRVLYFWVIKWFSLSLSLNAAPLTSSESSTFLVAFALISQAIFIVRSAKTYQY